MLWRIENGRRVFAGDANNEDLLEQVATDCGCFVADYEEELVSERSLTCLNCLYRRWLAQGFACQKKM